MELLVEPYEYLELADGASVRLVIDRFEWGESVIKPRYEGAPEEKRIPVLRLWPAAGYKPTGAPWWDVTAKTLQARLRPYLADLVAAKKEFVITAHGSGRRKRFSVEIP